ncbi:MAG: DPP IV N-terminal domain-containing protein [Fuerstiella sp.]
MLPNISTAQVYKNSVKANWSGDGNRFWYKNGLQNSQSEFVIVDALAGKKQLAFDHEAVAKQLSSESKKSVSAGRLPISKLNWDSAGRLIITAKNKKWIYDNTTTMLAPVEAKRPKNFGSRLSSRTLSSRTSDLPLNFQFVNESNVSLAMFWVSSSGAQQRYQTVAPGKSINQASFVGHAWLLKAVEGAKLSNIGSLRLQGSDDVITVTQQDIISRTQVRSPKPTRPNSRPGSNRPGSNRPSPNRPSSAQSSPDRKLSVSVKDHQLWMTSNDSPTQAKALTTDGSASNTYRKDASRARLLSMRFTARDYPDSTPDVRWSASSEWLVAFQTTVVPEGKVTYINSSPRNQLQPKVESYPYAKPGDEIPTPTLHLFNSKTGKEISVDNTLFKTPWQLHFLRFDEDGSRFWLKYNERGHQVVRIIEVQTETGVATTVMENVCDTFVHYSDIGKSVMQWISNDQVLWASERSGWNHLYLIDVNRKEVINPVTSGQWNVKRVESIDRTNGVVWFFAVGLSQGQDPYHEHFCKVNLDGSGFVQLTDGDGSHDITMSPDRRFFIDRFSRVDLPAITELRRTSDGAKVCDLESADASALIAARRLPERFVAKGRDGSTDIYGIIHFPKNFDPTKSYPVVENIYAGPHDHHVPKTFRPSYRHQHQIADKGMIVVQIDGMGTAWRSKAFHDVCYQNLRDAGFPDRILWIKAAAKDRPWMDVDRVGIYGGSAGGQSAMGALIWHGDFYKAAVSDCGCHDNRMDKIWWNEQWMGAPEGDVYERNSNTVNASLMQGKFMLVVGEMDRNVDPATTTQVVKAMIDADKDFVFLPVIGAGHGACETKYAAKRRANFLANALDAEMTN